MIKGDVLIKTVDEEERGSIFNFVCCCRVCTVLIQYRGWVMTSIPVEGQT